MPLLPKLQSQESVGPHAVMKYRVLPSALFLTGVVILFGAVGADLVSGGNSQFGLSQ